MVLQIKSSVDSLTEKFCPDFDLKAELEKGLVPSPPGSPTRKKGYRYDTFNSPISVKKWKTFILLICYRLFRNKRKYDPLISGQRKDYKKTKTGLLQVFQVFFS